jgi:hypothetical protein
VPPHNDVFELRTDLVLLLENPVLVWERGIKPNPQVCPRVFPAVIIAWSRLFAGHNEDCTPRCPKLNSRKSWWALAVKDSAGISKIQQGKEQFRQSQ